MASEPHIDANLVRDLIEEQFPELIDHDIRPVSRQGWDNRMFRLGERLVVRLPSAARYAPQVEKEQTWLPYLARHACLPVPAPVAMGRPTSRYPYAWSVMEWMDGDAASAWLDIDYAAMADSAAAFLRSLWSTDAKKGPVPGAHNFQRGGSLEFYNDETRQALDQLRSGIPHDALSHVWDRALSSSWQKPGVWLHGDFAPGNLLVRQGRLSAIIDFGALGVGDPACDLVLCWTLLPAQCRQQFRRAIDLDEDTWARARGWALWKALLILSEQAEAKSDERTARMVLSDLLQEHSNQV